MYLIRCQERMEVRLLFQVLLQFGSLLLVAYICHKGKTWSKPVVRRKTRAKTVSQAKSFMYLWPWTPLSNIATAQIMTISYPNTLSLLWDVVGSQLLNLTPSWLICISGWHLSCRFWFEKVPNKPCSPRSQSPKQMIENQSHGPSAILNWKSSWDAGEWIQFAQLGPKNWPKSC